MDLCVLFPEGDQIMNQTLLAGKDFLTKQFNHPPSGERL